MKMESDLDFAGPELHARGVELDCFSMTNPLCVRQDQRLGRVLAAQSIIGEMVAMTRGTKGLESGMNNTQQKDKTSIHFKISLLTVPTSLLFSSHPHSLSRLVGDALGTHTLVLPPSIFSVG